MSNDNNKVLLNFSSLTENTNEEILTVISSKYSKSKHKTIKSTSEPSKYWNLLKNVDLFIKYLVIDRIQNGWSLNSISSWLDIDIVTARAILYENKEELKKAEASQKKVKYRYNI